MVLTSKIKSRDQDGWLLKMHTILNLCKERPFNDIDK